jgi:hypothetical protein
VACAVVSSNEGELTACTHAARAAYPLQGTYTMKAGRIAGAAIVVLFGCRGAFAEPCAMINRQIYNLTAEMRVV